MIRVLRRIASINSMGISGKPVGGVGLMTLQTSLDAVSKLMMNSARQYQYKQEIGPGSLSTHYRAGLPVWRKTDFAELDCMRLFNMRSSHLTGQTLSCIWKQAI